MPQPRSLDSRGLDHLRAAFRAKPANEHVEKSIDLNWTRNHRSRNGQRCWPNSG